jgi:uncharacterized protein (DUF1786 family)
VKVDRGILDVLSHYRSEVGEHAVYLVVENAFAGVFSLNVDGEENIGVLVDYGEGFVVELLVDI